MFSQMSLLAGAIQWPDFVNGGSIALLGGVLAAVIAGLGSAKAVRMVGSTAAGIMNEKPELFGKLVILQALPGTQGIYGLLVWFFIMMYGGFFDGTAGELTLGVGFLYFLACVPMIVVGYLSAVHQAKVASDGAIMVAKNPGEQSKAIILAAMVETYAIFALLVSVLSIIMIDGLFA